LFGPFQGLDAGSTTRLAKQNLQIPEHASNRTLPSWLFDARLSARDKLTSSRPDAILVTPLPTKKHKSPITPHLHQVPRSRQHSRDVHRVQELNVNKREIHLVEFKYCEDTQPGHQYEASRKQHEVLCKRLKAKNSFPHTILLGVGGSIYNSHNVNHLKELGLDTHKAHKTALKSHAHSVLYAHKLTTTTSLLLLVVVVLDALLKNLVALKGLVWSRGQLVTLQILTRYSFSLVEETHFSLGQCVSFSLIDLGSGSTAYVVFLFFS